jgi:DNA-binding NarL/FixJ family response regulator
MDVLRLIAAGYTNQQIADELILSLGTVKTYSSHIYGKLNVENRTQAIAAARKQGLIR